MIAFVFILALILFMVGLLFLETFPPTSIFFFIMSFFSIGWGVMSCTSNYTKERTEQLPVYIIENHAIIMDGKTPRNVDYLKQFKEGDIVIKRIIGGEWIKNIYWIERISYERDSE